MTAFLHSSNSDFQGIEKHTKVLNGYTTIGNVKNPLDLRPKGKKMQIYS